MAVFATFTFRENITDKKEAAWRWRKLKERIRRMMPETHVETKAQALSLPFDKPAVMGIGVWQRQKRGAWHLHMAFNQWLDVELLRHHAVKSGFGPMLNLRYIEGSNRKGFSWNPRRVVQYMMRYIGRDIGTDQDKGVRVVEYFGNGVRQATTSFGWVGGFARLYRAGRQAWSDIFADDGQPTLDDYWFIIRLGWECSTVESRARAIAESDAVAAWWNPTAYPF